MSVKATNKITGEAIELPTNTPEQIIEAWQLAQEYEKSAKSLKDQLKKLVPNLIDDKGTSEPIGNFQFRLSLIQRMTYDKAVMREVLDPDLFDTLLEPNKLAIDTYLKENVERIGEVGTILRKTMVPVGNTYQVIKLEKL